MSDLLRESPALPPEDQRLVRFYTELGRPSDDLPYSVDFEEFVNRLRDAGDKRSEHEILRRLFQLRKAARLPRVGSITSVAIDIPPTDFELAEGLLRRHLGVTGSRDQLPYSEQFERIWSEYNRDASRQLDKHQLWRLIARVSK
jgi:hypothetical protein